MGALTPAISSVALAADADMVAWRSGFAARLRRGRRGRRARLHVKLDTGMGRLGTRDPAQALRVAAARGRGRALELVGADDALRDRREPDATSSAAARSLRAGRGEFRCVHPDASCTRPTVPATLATSGALRHGPLRRRDLRAGPFGEDPAARGLEPALSLRSWVADVKQMRAGDSAGYGRTLDGRATTNVATVPIGYGDGYRRGFANKARRAHPRAAPAARRHGEHGQHHASTSAPTPPSRPGDGRR